MALIRKITLIFSVVFCGSLALAAAAIAAGGGGGLGPGDYVFSNTSASAQFGIPGPTNLAPGFDISVSRGLNSFQLENSEDRPPVVTDSTIVNLQIFGPQGQGFFCFALKNQSDFKVSSDLKSASLKTKLTSDELCNFGGPVTGKGTSKAPLAGGGGPGLVPPFNVDIKWKATGIHGSGKDRSTFDCGDYSTEATSTIKTAGENATGTLDVLSGSFSTSAAGINSSATHMNVQGNPRQGCFGF